MDIISLTLAILDPFRFPPLHEKSPLQPGDHSLAKEESIVVLVRALEEIFFYAKPAPEVIETARMLLKQRAGISQIQPAVSTFAGLSLSDQPRSGEPPVYSFLSLQMDNPFPKKAAAGDFSTLMNDFRHDFVNALQQAASPESFFRMCLRMMERYTWCIASAESPAGVSLFDSASLLSAVTACIDQSGAKPSFILLAADFSGIQRYIFPEGGRHQGAAKKLRARSFLVSAVMQLVQHLILKAFDLPLTSSLMNSGGNLYILLPDIPDIGQRCQALRCILDREIFTRFHGAVSVHIATTKMHADEFSKFGLTIQRIKNALKKEKQRAFHSFLTNDGVWSTDKPLEMSGHREQGLCDGCGRAFAENHEGLCSDCLNEQEIGRRLTKINTISLVRGTSGFITLNGWSLTFGEQGENVFALTSHDKSTRLWPVIRLANYVPADENGQPVTFDQLAVQYSCGVKKLAVLKADVDRMGALFAYGFASESDPFCTSSLQYTALSRMLEYFFCEYLAILIRVEFPHCYTVFSGGDDLLIVGPWQEIIDLAQVIQKRFTDYICGNPDITLSAGITLFSHKTPISFAVHDADQALESAKKEGERQEGRNQLYLFGRAMKWENAHKVLEYAHTVDQWHRGKYLTSGDLYKMRTWALMFQRYYKDRYVLGLRYAALAAYDLGKKLEERRKYPDDLLNLLESLQIIHEAGPIHHLQVICDYALFKNRRKDYE